MADWFGKDTPKLGFGLMRLPKRGLGIDVAQTSEMVDRFLGAGFTYFDTAHVYAGSEAATKKALVDRYPRESYTLATKLNAQVAPTAGMARKQFQTSLDRTGAGYIDYYLLHALMDGNWKKYERLGLWEYVRGLKAEGLVRHVGFSFHGGPDLLDRLLTSHPEAEFVQLQLNYADWEDRSITARANYEVARAHGTSIVVMEPVKGGRLANPPRDVAKLLEAANPGDSPASWAIRFAASLDGIITVLSGMSNLAQMDDNIGFMRDFRPLDEGEREVIRQAQVLLGKSSAIGCTACRYCCDGCPQSIPIPEVFAAMNLQLANGQLEEARSAYATAIGAPGAGSAADCIACGQCEAACPQHLPIIKRLAEAAEQLG
ncbi:MAG: Fe-S oxidoreductase [Olsenella sp.]|nr:Fe-S oxidoreductase [Olsenella sp.]